MRDPRSRPLLLPTCLALSLLCLGPWAASAQTMTDPNLVITDVFTTGGLHESTTMAFLGPDDFLVLEKATGRVKRVISGVLQQLPPYPLDVHVNSESERGMLGIAIQQGSPIQIYLYYTEAAGMDGGPPLGNRVYRYDWNPAGSGSLVNPQLILDLPVNPGPNHDGGIVALDGSGRLSVVVGSVNHFGQLQNLPTGNAPDDTGVILRVNSDGTAAPGNPFTPYCSVATTTTCTADGDCPPGQVCRTQVARYFAYGILDSFGMALDPMTGFLWATERGATTMDEINLVAAGFNSGWTQITGPDARDPQSVGDLFNMPGFGLSYSDPEFSWVDAIAPTAILFPVGTSWGPSYDNVALVADRNIIGTSGSIYRFPLNGPRTGFDLSAFPALLDLVADSTAERNLVRIGTGFDRIEDMKIGPDHHVYVVNVSCSPPSPCVTRILRIAGPVPVELQGFTVE